MDIEKLRKMTDKELYSLCLEWGANARMWIRKFASLLPEVNRRGLFRGRGFHSIYEFAAKLGGMNNNAVDEVLRVSEKLADKPALGHLLAQHGWSKLRVVATIATPENQHLLAEKVKTMSKSVLETFVREVGRNNFFRGDGGTAMQDSLFCGGVGGGGGGGDGGEKPDGNSRNASTGGLTQALPTFLPGEEMTTISFKISVKTETSLRIFRHKMEKLRREPQSFEQVMENLLETALKHENCRLRAGIKTNKARLAPPEPRCADGVEPAAPGAQPTALAAAHPAPSPGNQQPAPIAQPAKRYIPASIRHSIDEKYQGRCAFPDCKNAADSYHHTKRFALTASHDPGYIAPLCTVHERLAHHGLIKNEESPPESWKIQLHPDKNSPKYAIDLAVQKHRKPDG